MKSLSLWQPWASMLFVKEASGYPVKRDETRHWPTNIRGRIAIHAAKTKEGSKDIDALDLAPFGLSYDTMPFGALIGTVNLVACHNTERIRSQRTDANLYWGNYGPGRYAFEVKDVKLFPSPLPYRGMQGFFDVPDSVLAQLAEAQ